MDRADAVCAYTATKNAGEVPDFLIKNQQVDAAQNQIKETTLSRFHVPLIFDD
jgi:hypothetical protein